ncbi:hypothetical protein NPIL_492931 [Nephila pilipes]|uniref:Uncharacterized protein n=1 Tax=Nephila pilipes TaxID=299642 RepID=A0A8X6NDF3_NEPPI|nr:hypothetical protein NPIL_492931 [Nephila pilipes]
MLARMKYMTKYGMQLVKKLQKPSKASLKRLELVTIFNCELLKESSQLEHNSPPRTVVLPPVRRSPRSYRLSNRRKPKKAPCLAFILYKIYSEIGKFFTRNRIVMANYA